MITKIAVGFALLSGTLSSLFGERDQTILSFVVAIFLIAIDLYYRD